MDSQLIISNPHTSTLITRLDIGDFLRSFVGFFAREKSFVFEGDRQFFGAILQELDSIPLTPPPPLPCLDTPLIHLQKHGTLHLEDIFAFMQLVGYFLYLKSRFSTESKGIDSKRSQDNHDDKTPSPTPRFVAWLDKILIPQAMIDMQGIFDSSGNLKEGVYPHIDTLNEHIKHNKIHIDEAMNKILHSRAIASYLVDNAVH